MNFKELLYKKEVDKDTKITKYFIFNGLLYLKNNHECKTFEYRLLGISVIRTKIVDKFKVYYFFFLPFFVTNIAKTFRNEFLDKVLAEHPQYDDYYIFLSRSGEFFLLMHHLKELLANNNSKNFILIFGVKYHLNICKMFFPNIPCVYYKGTNVYLISKGVNDLQITYKNKKIYFPFWEKYFVEVEDKIKNENAHYYELLKKHLNLISATETYNTSNDTKSKIAHYIKYNLGDKFVLISPESLSNKLMEKDFWDNFSQKLKLMGYKIYCNAMNFYNLIPGTESIFLTYEESIELSKYAKAIIGMRSGFIECLSQNNVPMFVLYTDFPDRGVFKRLPSDKVLSGFTISKLPNINQYKLFEYDVNKYEDQNEIIETIIKKLEEINNG